MFVGLDPWTLRAAVADLLMDASSVLGGETTLQLLAQPLFQVRGRLAVIRILLA